jgi:hypothetical protein
MFRTVVPRITEFENCTECETFLILYIFGCKRIVLQSFLKKKSHGEVF